MFYKSFFGWCGVHVCSCIKYDHRCWHQSFFRVVYSIHCCVSEYMSNSDTKIAREANTTLSNTHTHQKNAETTIGWHPYLLAVRTSNRLIEPIKPQIQRALLKPLFPAATDLHPCVFFLHPSISLATSIDCFLIHSSFLPLQHFFPSISHPPLLLMFHANGTSQRSDYPISTSPSRNCSSKTCQSTVAF